MSASSLAAVTNPPAMPPLLAPPLPPPVTPSPALLVGGSMSAGSNALARRPLLTKGLSPTVGSLAPTPKVVPDAPSVPATSAAMKEKLGSQRLEDLLRALFLSLSHSETKLGRERFLSFSQHVASLRGVQASGNIAEALRRQREELAQSGSADFVVFPQFRRYMMSVLPELQAGVPGQETMVERLLSEAQQQRPEASLRRHRSGASSYMGLQVRAPVAPTAAGLLSEEAMRASQAPPSRGQGADDGGEAGQPAAANGSSNEPPPRPPAINGPQKLAAELAVQEAMQLAPTPGEPDGDKRHFADWRHTGPRGEFSSKRPGAHFLADSNAAPPPHPPGPLAAGDPAVSILHASFGRGAPTQKPPVLAMEDDADVDNAPTFPLTTSKPMLAAAGKTGPLGDSRSSPESSSRAKAEREDSATIPLSQSAVFPQQRPSAALRFDRGAVEVGDPLPPPLVDEARIRSLNDVPPPASIFAQFQERAGSTSQQQEIAAEGELAAVGDEEGASERESAAGRPEAAERAKQRKEEKEEEEEASEEVQEQEQEAAISSAQQQPLLTDDADASSSGCAANSCDADTVQPGRKEGRSTLEKATGDGTSAEFKALSPRRRSLPLDALVAATDGIAAAAAVASASVEERAISSTRPSPPPAGASVLAATTAAAAAPSLSQLEDNSRGARKAAALEAEQVVHPADRKQIIGESEQLPAPRIRPPTTLDLEKFSSLLRQAGKAKAAVEHDPFRSKEKLAATVQDREALQLAGDGASKEDSPKFGGSNAVGATTPVHSLDRRAVASPHRQFFVVAAHGSGGGSCRSPPAHLPRSPMAGALSPAQLAQARLAARGLQASPSPQGAKLEQPRPPTQAASGYGSAVSAQLEGQHKRPGPPSLHFTRSLEATPTLDRADLDGGTSRLLTPQQTEVAEDAQLPIMATPRWCRAGPESSSASKLRQPPAALPAGSPQMPKQLQEGGENSQRGPFFEIFRAFDLDGDGRLNQGELWRFADQIVGFEGDCAQWSSIYQRVCQRLGVDPVKGVDQSQFALFAVDTLGRDAVKHAREFKGQPGSVSVPVPSRPTAAERKSSIPSANRSTQSRVRTYVL
eukprot:TRINITY_DN38190_c0_g2_i1.p1 TRINITY_DN38190_c0_g2~~TRINITY_DN38190_c0_g2_i1.p1  ORF type:complete len:1090 (+),score=297.97 TRINITY_DN38190_c0_g2_i1:207-3476(+)